MELTEARVILKDSPDKKLKAYVTVTFDNAFVVRNIKVIEGTSGLFIAMPSRKVRQPCLKCHFKNEVRSKFCNQCGVQIPAVAPAVPAGTAAAVAVTAAAEHGHSTQLEHKDIAHPITQSFREYLQKQILEAYERELLKGPGATHHGHEDLD
jgi:stage V sporulation protein G